jgi:hypothetical protein
MPSARDNCFKKAVEKLKDNGKLKKLDVQDQRRWVRDGASGTWSQTSEVWYKVVGAVSRARRAIAKGLGLPEGAIDATRIPDMTVTPEVTVTPEGGKPIVIDNKFDGDSFRDDQLKDYNEINKQQNGNPNAKDLRLDSSVCKCGDPGALDPVPVPVPVPMPFYVPGINADPGVLPELVPSLTPVTPPVTSPPVGVPELMPVFP